MDIKIIETNETAELALIDPSSGVNWINDLMGNHNELPELEEDEDGMDTGYYLMDQESFEWWANLTREYTLSNDRLRELLQTADSDTSDSLLADIQAINVDLGDYPNAVNTVCGWYDKAE